MFPFGSKTHMKVELAYITSMHDHELNIELVLLFSFHSKLVLNTLKSVGTMVFVLSCL